VGAWYAAGAGVVATGVVKDATVLKHKITTERLLRYPERSGQAKTKGD